MSDDKSGTAQTAVSALREREILRAILRDPGANLGPNLSQAQLAILAIVEEIRRARAGRTRR